MTADVPPRGPLTYLRWNWGTAYAITAAGGHCVAMRRDNGRTLHAATPEALRELVVEDYAEQPVSREVAP
jgi:hypothetical protein